MFQSQSFQDLLQTLGRLTTEQLLRILQSIREKQDQGEVEEELLIALVGLLEYRNPTPGGINERLKIQARN